MWNVLILPVRLISTTERYIGEFPCSVSTVPTSFLHTQGVELLIFVLLFALHKTQVRNTRSKRGAKLSYDSAEMRACRSRCLDVTYHVPLFSMVVGV